MARYIDADALKNDGHLCWNDGKGNTYYEIDHAPTADVVEVKHGYWLLLDECANAGVYCSVCHKKVYKEEYANQKLKSKFCPNCGAKMDLKEGVNI